MERISRIFALVTVALPLLLALGVILLEMPNLILIPTFLIYATGFIARQRDRIAVLHGQLDEGGDTAITEAAQAQAQVKVVESLTGLDDRLGGTGDACAGPRRRCTACATGRTRSKAWSNAAS